MDIIIRIHDKNASVIFENIKACFLQEFPDKEFEWKRTGTVYTTKLQEGGEEIVRIFEELVERYPELDVEASYSYDVREGDTSAQWWGTTRIYSERKDGKTEIVSSSSTYWN